MLEHCTLIEMAEGVRARKFSPLDLVEAHLAQIERHNPQLNAFVMQFPSEARREARQLEHQQPEGPLHGVPVTIKDSFDVANLPTLCGSKFRLSHRAAKDSSVVARLRAAGAIILGKTNCPEFLANYDTDNYIIGPTKNPWNLARTAGGSSGGESAAIASFCSAGGIGSDGGGSIRIPAHFCGIAGLKPTPGRVSAAGHYPEIGHPGGLLGVAGPMARSAADLRVLFEALAGYDPDDPFSAPVPVRKASVDGLRIGVVEELCGVPVQEPVKGAVRKAAAKLREVGIETEAFNPQGIDRAPDLWWFFFTELTAPFTRQIIDGHEQDAHWTGRELVDMVPRDMEISGKTVVENLAARDGMRSSLLRQMKDCPVLLVPPCGVAAWPHGERGWQTETGSLDLRRAMAQVTPFNLFGMPALVIPFDLGADGMPIGIQLVARPYDEELLLEVGVRLEEARGKFPSPPGF